MIDGTILYVDATRLSHENGQTIGDRNDYYITLEQLMVMIKNQESQTSIKED